MSIRNYSDHAANERTFLAWVRTSIAITAFGFLIERFDLFLSVMVPAVSGERFPLRRTEFGPIAGLILICAGVVMVILSALRFVRTAREIDDRQILPGTGSRLDVALASLLALLGVALFFYLYNAVAAHR